MDPPDRPTEVVTDSYDLAEDEELWARIGIEWSERSEGSERSERREAGLDQVDKLSGSMSPITATRSQLSMSLRPHLLRATPLYEALAGCCRHWRSSDSDGELFHISRPVNSIDVFLKLGLALGHQETLREGLTVCELEHDHL